MTKMTIREIILSVPPEQTKSLLLEGIEVEGYRQEAVRLNRESREKGVCVPGGKPLYTISVNKKVGRLFIINNLCDPVPQTL